MMGVDVLYALTVHTKRSAFKLILFQAKDAFKLRKIGWGEARQ
jgi:hypothetical protein